MAWTNEAERIALLQKLEHPGDTVACPNCGTELVYRRQENSERVECPTCHISGGSRGV